MAAESTAASITASITEPDPIHTPCPHCGVTPATTPDPMGSVIACLRAVVEAQAPRVVTSPYGDGQWHEVVQTNWEA